MNKILRVFTKKIYFPNYTVPAIQRTVIETDIEVSTTRFGVFKEEGEVVGYENDVFRGEEKVFRAEEEFVSTEAEGFSFFRHRFFGLCFALP
jgi:hypothetical protein